MHGPLVYLGLCSVVALGGRGGSTGGSSPEIFNNAKLRVLGLLREHYVLLPIFKVTDFFAYRTSLTGLISSLLLFVYTGKTLYGRLSPLYFTKHLRSKCQIERGL